MCFIAAAAACNITTTVNRGMRARPMSSLLLSDVYGCSCHCVVCIIVIVAIVVASVYNVVSAFCGF